MKNERQAFAIACRRRMESRRGFRFIAASPTLSANNFTAASLAALFSFHLFFNRIEPSGALDKKVWCRHDSG